MPNVQPKSPNPSTRGRATVVKRNPPKVKLPSPVRIPRPPATTTNK